MSTIFIQATAQCASGGHVEMTAILNAGQPRKINLLTVQLRENVTGEETEAMVLALCRLHGIGISDTQLRTDLQAGITVTI